MTIPPSDRPRLATARLHEILAKSFGCTGRLEPLASERDQNHHVVPTKGPGWLLKVSNAHDDRSLLEMQDALLHRLADSDNGFSYPVPVADPVEIEDDEGLYVCRLLRWVPGTPLADCRPQPPTLLAEVGELMGATAAALAGFEHAAAKRSLQWDLTRTAELCRGRLDAITDGARRELVERWLERVAPALQAARGLRHGVIQNDGNDHNILCGPVRDRGEVWRRNVVGLVDVGDAIEQPTVVECAVAMAYAMLDREDPIAAGAAVVAGFHSRMPLDEQEIACLPDLAAARLCLSVCNSAVQQAEEEENRYLSVSEKAAWRALDQLERTSYSLAHYRLRAACALEPCPSAGRVREWLREHREEMIPMVESPRRIHVFDLGVGSTEMGGGAPGVFDTTALTQRLFGLIQREGAGLGYGRYDEARCWYGGELFAGPGNEGPRRRTVHIGVDLFLPPGAPLHSPLAGRVVDAGWNRGRLDYGPTLVLEHRPAEGVRFWTLWGHLDPDCLDRLSPGDDVEAGQEIARIGDFPDNGDWPPHLHLQILCDRLGHEGDFPGVVDPDQREVWTSICPDPALLLPLPGLDEAIDEADARLAIPTPAALLERRRAVLAPSLSVSYRRPLHIVRGFRQFLYSAEGQPYLDAVNNVPHVGHSHPHVVAAAAAQNELLNTNTRYLHESILDYAERLTALMPDPLSVCFLVCSGSEANELAVRLARIATGARGIVAVEGGYHGNTSTLVDLSHYKHAGPGGAGAPDWVRVVAMPDPYRGKHRNATDPGAAYADEVGLAARQLASRRQDGGLAGFLVEALLGCGGQIVPPSGYLSAAFEQVRAAGGVCIADEVQIGLGRVGSHMWAFEQQVAVPDIVTLGKPIGNGFPLAAVITTREIADVFANGMEYFSTFGGNPVACEVGAAVLDVLEQEQLPAQAETVGQRLLEGLVEVGRGHEIVGDVRGVGLYLGVELVRDPNTLEPADVEASYVVNRMRDRGILVSTDGPLHNVVKMKPPLCFDADDADRLVAELDAVLGEDLPTAAG